MSERVLLSFVVPVYNVEKYLKECLDSIFDPSADEDEYEVIAVNDGSTDGSLEILKTYTSHRNFRIITQKNAGLGPARNTGIYAAKGKYISFIDSDDYLSPGAVQTLLGFARGSDCDIVEFEFELRQDLSKPVWHYEPPTKRTPMSGKGKELFAEWQRQKVFLPAAWKRIYKRNFIDAYSLCFLPMIYEDVPWQLKCFFCAESVVYNPVVLYHYRQREGSITLMPAGVKECWDYIKLTCAMEKFRTSIELDKENADFLRELGATMASYLERTINLMYKHASGPEKEKMFSELKKHRHLLAFAMNKKGRRLYKMTRYLPAKLAFRMYKIF